MPWHELVESSELRAMVDHGVEEVRVSQRYSHAPHIAANWRDVHEQDTHAVLPRESEIQRTGNWPVFPTWNFSGATEYVLALYVATAYNSVLRHSLETELHNFCAFANSTGTFCFITFRSKHGHRKLHVVSSPVWAVEIETLPHRCADQVGLENLKASVHQPQQPHVRNAAWRRYGTRGCECLCKSPERAQGHRALGLRIAVNPNVGEVTSLCPDGLGKARHRLCQKYTQPSFCSHHWADQPRGARRSTKHGL